MAQAPWWLPLLIAAASLVVVPALVAMGKRLLTAWREARQARLAKQFVLREEMEMHFEQLSKTQERQHAENKAFLDTIRTEALQREGRLTAALDGIKEELRDDAKGLRDDVSKVHTRVDNVLAMLGNRRRQ